MKLPKKVPYNLRVNKQSNRTMIMKAVNNAAAGFPISALLNVVFTLPISQWWLSIHGLVWLYPFVLGAPFVIVSVFRQYIIDYYIAMYNINCDPSYLIKKGASLLAQKLKKKQGYFKCVTCKVKDADPIYYQYCSEECRNN